MTSAKETLIINIIDFAKTIRNKNPFENGATG